MTSRILAISLGGTIALSVKDGKAVATDGADQLVSKVALQKTEVKWSTHQFLNKDSIDITLGDLARLCFFINSKSAEFSGFIVTTGTDTLEEVSYFLHEAFGDRLNIIVTGAMRPPYSKNFDGAVNFNFATTTSLSHISQNHGVFVAISGHVIPAMHVAKKSSVRLDSFEPVYSHNFNAHMNPQSRQNETYFENILPDVSAFSDINIPIVAVSIGTKFCPIFFEAADGCVISCPGAFSLPESIIPKLQELAVNIPIVLASRCIHNEPVPDGIYPGYQKRQEALGFLIREYAGLSPQQSRLKLVFDILRTRQVNACK